MNPHIFADPDPGSQNLADPTDPDPDPKALLKIIAFLKVSLFSDLIIILHYLKCPTLPVE